MSRKTVVALTLMIAASMMGAGTASAEVFAMSSIYRQFCCSDWTNKAGGAPNPGGGGPALLGGIINQKATVNRTVMQTVVSPPFQLTIPQSRIGATTMAVGLPHPSPLIDTITIQFSGFNDLGVMVEGGGPGTFEFCPESVGPAVGACGAPLSATGGPSNFPYHGRISVTQGVNRFGGSMGLLGGATGVLNLRNAAGAAATLFTANFINLPFSVIGAGNGASPVAVQPFDLRQVFYATSMHNGAPLSTLFTGGRATGHKWTTGMVTASITAMNTPPFQAVTLTGGDTRITAGPNIGQGNVTLVSGNLYQNLGTGSPQVRGNRLSMNLPEPGAALSVGAGAAILLLAGATRRRR